MQRKVYQATNYQYLDTYVEVKGQKTLIQFRGGTLQPRLNGKFATDDPDVIAALDADINRLGAKASFKCIHSEEIPGPKEENAPVKSTAPQSAAPLGEPVKDAPAGDNAAPIAEIPGITTVQDAKEYLLDKFADSVKISHLPNKDAVQKVAAEKRIKFVDLK